MKRIICAAAALMLVGIHAPATADPDKDESGHGRRHERHEKYERHERHDGSYKEERKYEGPEHHDRRDSRGYPPENARGPAVEVQPPGVVIEPPSVSITLPPPPPPFKKR